MRNIPAQFGAVNSIALYNYVLIEAVPLFVVFVVP
jgi:hypothetical protein